MYSDTDLFENYMCSLSATRLHILMYILDEARENGGVCERTHEQIAKAVNCSARAVSSAVSNAKSYGYVMTRNEGPRASKIFVKPEIIEKLDSAKNSYWYKLLSNKNLIN